MQAEDSAQPNLVDLSTCGSEINDTSMESPTITSLNGLTSLDSGKSVKCPISQASPDNSSQSEPFLKAHDYIGLEVEISTRPLRNEGTTLHQEGHPQTVVEESMDLNLQETELRLGPPKVGASFQSQAHTAMEPKAGELLLLNAASRRQDFANPHPLVQRDQGSEGLVKRYSKESRKALDFGICLSSQILPFSQEEVGENKVSCLGSRNVHKRILDCQEQLSKHEDMFPHNRVRSVSEAFDEEQKHLPLNAAAGHGFKDPQSSRSQQLRCPGASDAGLFSCSAVSAFHEGDMSHLQELSAAQRFWQARMMLRAADSSFFPTNHELPPCIPQDVEANPAGGFSTTLSGSHPITQRGTPTTPRSTIAGAKRVFSEAITDGAVVLSGAAKVANSGVVDTAADSESKALNQHQQPFSRSSTIRQPQSVWPTGLDSGSGAMTTFGPLPSAKSLVKSEHSVLPSNYSFHAPSPESSSASAQKIFPDSANCLQQQSQSNAMEEIKDSAPRGPIGWPPVQSFRKNSLPPPKSKGIAERKQSPALASTIPPSAPAPKHSESHFVKVYMDGLPFGRKVDLSMNDDYEKLSSVLEEMFKGFITVQSGNKEAGGSSREKQLKFLRSSEYVLTYEDKDGDLMLVGDVPWQMFIAVVRRLRIMKGSEAIGIAPRLLGPAKCT